MARILFADDEPDLVEVFAEILRDEGHEVRTAADGGEALRAIRTWRPDVAVLDADMPGLTGPGVAAELSRDRGGLGAIPVVLLSGNADAQRHAAGAGIRYCVSKPIAPDEFVRLVASTLADAQPPPGS